MKDRRTQALKNLKFNHNYCFVSNTLIIQSEFYCSVFDLFAAYTDLFERVADGQFTLT